MLNKPSVLRLVCLWLTLMGSAHATTTLVAVASNFTKPMTDIAAAFEQATGHHANLSFGSSGKFMAQLENGAPFEVFLSADDEKPAQFERAGLAVAGTRFTYAQGTLVLWSPQPGFVDAEGKVLGSGQFKHLALADPKLAPYGVAAIEVMTSLGLLETIKPLLVTGENISQAHQFVTTGNAELGFVALSQVYADGNIEAGSAWRVPVSLYSPIRQDVVLMTKGAENPAATALLTFMKSAPALAIIEKYGYGIAK